MKRTIFRADGIILDLDGTLIDSKRAYLKAVKTALASTKHKTFDINIVTEIPKRIEQNLPIDDMLVGVDASRFLKIYLSAYHNATIAETKPFPNILETLKELSCKARLSLVTMRHVPKHRVVEELERLGLARYFHSVVTALDTAYPKPSPEALFQCARNMAVEISDCMIVGDSIMDIRAGKSAGTATVGVLSGIYARNELEREKPDLILENVSFLPDFLE